MFLLYSSTNVKSQKEIMSCKSCRTYKYLTRKKGKRLVLKCMVPKKPKAYSQNEISKISGINLKKRCKGKK